MNPTPRRPRVLIIDDVATVAKSAAAHLEAAGFETRVTENGAQGLSEGRRFAPDLVIADILMPVVDGFEFLRRAKASAALRSVPVIMLSSVNERDRVMQCLLLGAVDYLLKPFDPATLVKKALKHVRVAEEESEDRPEPPPPAPVAADGRPSAIVAVRAAGAGAAITEALAEKLETLPASDGALVLDLAIRHTPGAVVLDARLPVFDAFEVIASLRSTESGRQVAFAVVAPKEDLDAASRAKKLGDVDLLLTPLDPEALAAFVAKAAGSGDEEEGASAAKSDAVFEPALLEALRSVPSDGGRSPLDEVLEAFLTDAPERIAAMKEALEKGDKAAAGVVAHALKGGSSAVGANALAALCASLETEAAAGSIAATNEVIPRLESLLATTRESIDAWRRGSAETQG